MRGKLILLVFMASMPLWPQVAPSAAGGGPASQMMIPPPVSNSTYPTSVGADAHSNYIRGGITESTAYINNLYAGSGMASIAETTISILPSIDLDTTAGKQHFVAAYTPGFTFYRPSSSLNEIDETALIDYDLRPTPHTAINANDEFQDSSTPFYNPAMFASIGTVSGTPGPLTPGVIPPFAQFLSNTASVEFTAQTGMNTMFGASGSSMTLHYPNSAETAGLYDSSSRGGTGFYNHRISDAQYAGLTYQYSDILSYLVGETSTTEIQSIMGYYTLYMKSKLSFSLLAGPQHYTTTLPPFPVSSGWGPSITASMGWQGMRTSLSASYSQSVTGGGGVLGAYRTKAASATASWKLARTWTASAAAAYSIIKPVTSSFSFLGMESGHTVSGTMSLDHSMGQHWHVRFDYVHLHESYANIAAISSNPDSDSEAVSIVWQFMRPLGR
jgi:hypothetical protein